MTSPARTSAYWRFTFCDLRTRSPLARLPLRDADLSEVIGGVGQGSGQVPITAASIRARDPWTATQPRRTIAFGQRVVTMQGREIAAPCLWAGIVWKRVRSARSLRLTMATPESYWAMRKVAADRVFAQADDAVIQRTLFADATAVAAGDIGLTLGTNLLSTVSDRTVAVADLKSVLEVATTVATAARFEWRILPGIDSSGAFTLTLVQATRLGRDIARHLVWVSAPDGRPGNELVGYELTEDGTGVPNRVIGLGAGQPPAQLRSVITAADIGSTEVADGYPLLEASLNLSDTGDLSQQSSLDRHTAAELRGLRAAEEQITSLTVRGDRGPTVDTYTLGDTLTLRLNDPLQKTPRDYTGRLLARRILPAQPGRNEMVAMTLGSA